MARAREGRIKWEQMFQKNLPAASQASCSKWVDTFYDSIPLSLLNICWTWIILWSGLHAEWKLDTCLSMKKTTFQSRQWWSKRKSLVVLCKCLKSIYSWWCKLILGRTYSITDGRVLCKIGYLKFHMSWTCEQLSHGLLFDGCKVYKESTNLDRALRMCPYL